MRKKDSTLTRVEPLFTRMVIEGKILDFLHLYFGVSCSKCIAYFFTSAKLSSHELRLSPSKERLIQLIHKQIGRTVSKMDKAHMRDRIVQGDVTVIDEAISIINNQTVNRYNSWAYLEGLTCIDVFFETTDYVFIGEAKRTENRLTNHTQHDDERSQMIRHIDAALVHYPDKKVVPFFVFDQIDTIATVFTQASQYSFEYIRSKLDYYDENKRDMLMNRILLGNNGRIPILTFQDINNKLVLNVDLV